MIKRINKIILGSIITILAGCSTFSPTYRPDPNDHHVTKINISKLMRAQICVDGKWFRLKKDELGNAVIPTGQAITLRNIYFDEKDETYEDLFFSCRSSLSFVPQENHTYYANFDIQDTTCFIEVFAQDPSRAVGLSAIATDPPNC